MMANVGTQLPDDKRATLAMYQAANFPENGKAAGRDRSRSGASHL
jgi:hypothetical protein